jgi:FlaA1/EpsC-like NDP-sugar epimerase
MKDGVKRYLGRLRNYLVNLPRSRKTAVTLVADFFGFAISAIAALWLMGLEAVVSGSLAIIAFIAIIAISAEWLQGMYRSVVRYIGTDLFVGAMRTAVTSAVVGAALLNLFVFGVTPYRWAVAFTAFSFIHICGTRYAARLFLLNNQSAVPLQRVIVYGAGAAGAQLVASLRGGDEFEPVAVLDDDARLHGSRIQGVEVFAPSRAKELSRELVAHRILLAMPSARHGARRRIIEKLVDLDVHVQTIPDFGDIVSGRAQVDELKDVDVEDLLGRDPVPPNPGLLTSSVSGRNVMITGAGGSIGSELCRQILHLEPSRLILFERSEVALYETEQELQAMRSKEGIECELVALLGSVQDRLRVEEVFQTFAIDCVYHAAAYKHVPVVEQNMIEGVQNNVFGTLETALAAISAGVKTFVLVSTDKAVSPTNIMGATKRLSEMTLQALQELEHDTCFCMVRFGNVLASSGSVVPLFRRQIREGGPVTVTHKDIIRYFMTIPEAAQLVIQAGAMGKGGDVFVLDMGEPVKIFDLARRLISLMGLQVLDEENPDGDIEINISGLRPAEKLYEELLIGSNTTKTSHPRIMRAQEEFLAIADLEKCLEALRSALVQRDRSQTRAVLRAVVQGYAPSNGIDDLVSVETSHLESETSEKKAADTDLLRFSA